MNLTLLHGRIRFKNESPELISIFRSLEHGVILYYAISAPLKIRKGSQNVSKFTDRQFYHLQLKIASSSLVCHYVY